MAEFVTSRDLRGFHGSAIVKEEAAHPTGSAIKLTDEIRLCLETLRRVGPPSTKKTTASDRYRYDLCLKAVRSFEASIGKQIYREPAPITSAISTWATGTIVKPEELVEGSEEWCREKCKAEGLSVFQIGACVDKCIEDHKAPAKETCEDITCDVTCVTSGYSKGACVASGRGLFAPRVCQCSDEELPPPPPPYIEPGFFDKLKASLPSWWPWGLGAVALLGGGYLVMKKKG